MQSHLAPMTSIIREGSSKVVEAVVLSRIANGTYGSGERVPSVRDLAAELNVNRNTVSKVSRELQRRGVLVSRRGNGVYVQTSSIIEAGKPIAEDRVRDALRGAFSFAAMMGVAPDRLRRLVSEQFGIIFDGDLRIAFIECNLEEAEGTARRMRRELGYPVDPFVLEELPDQDSLIKTHAIISTTFYHLPEVRAWLGAREVEPIGLEHSPSTESKLAIARLRRGTGIGTIAVNERTLNVLVSLVEMYHGTTVGACLVGETIKVQQLAAHSDVLVVHPLASRFLESKPGNRLIVVDFQIQAQSLAYLREQIVRHLDRRQMVLVDAQ